MGHLRSLFIATMASLSVDVVDMGACLSKPDEVSLSEASKVEASEKCEDECSNPACCREKNELRCEIEANGHEIIDQESKIYKLQQDLAAKNVNHIRQVDKLKVMNAVLQAALRDKEDIIEDLMRKLRIARSNNAFEAIAVHKEQLVVKNPKGKILFETSTPNAGEDYAKFAGENKFNVETMNKIDCLEISISNDSKLETVKERLQKVVDSRW